MPIIQISQIKHRRGPRNNLPSLSEGEFGFAVDTGEVFIGAPNVPSIKKRGDEGTFPYHNVAILTETTDNIANYLFYTYRDRFIEYNTTSAIFTPTTTIANPVTEYFEPKTSANISFTVARKLQEKIDEHVSVKDYGALGEGTFESLTMNSTFDESYLNLETAAIRKAAVDLSNTIAEESVSYGYHPKTLYFPSGIYMINDSILIPPYAHFKGDGPTQTIVAMVSAKNISDKEFRCLGFTVDGDFQHDQVNDKTSILAHSYSNMNFPSESQYQRSIIFEDMTFIVAIDPLTKPHALDVFRFIGAKNVFLKNCRIIGNWGFPFIGGTNPAFEFKNSTNGDFYYEDSACIIFDSYDQFGHQYKPENLHVENTWIGNAAYGFIGTDDMKNITFKNCLFNRLWRGVSVNEPLITTIGNLSYVLTKGSRGPKNVVINNCSFFNIKREAIANFSDKKSDGTNFEDFSIGGVGTVNNYYENVGANETNNGILDETSYAITTPVSPVVNFSSAEHNYSFNDRFSRNYLEEKIGLPFGNHQFSRIYSKNELNFISNVYETRLPKRTTILSANKTIFTDTNIKFDQNESPRARIYFSISFSEAGTDKKREGEATLLFTSPSNISFVQSYTDAGTISINLSAFVSGSHIDIKYINNHSVDVPMKFRVEFEKD